MTDGAAYSLFHGIGCKSTHRIKFSLHMSHAEGVHRIAVGCRIDRPDGPYQSVAGKAAIFPI